MVRASFLIQDEPFSHDDFFWLRDELVVRFGECTSERRIERQWRAEGTRYVAEYYRFVVVLEEDKRDQLETLLRAACARFRHEAIYLELVPVEVKTISVTDSDGKR